MPNIGGSEFKLQFIKTICCFLWMAITLALLYSVPNLPFVIHDLNTIYIGLHNKIADILVIKTLNLSGLRMFLKSHLEKNFTFKLICLSSQIG